MRVLFVTPFFPPDYTGGAEVSLYHSARGLMQRGVQVSILTINMRMPETADHWYDLDGLHVHRVRFGSSLPGGEIFDPRIYRSVRREIAALAPDIVHVHNASGASLAPHAAARHAGAPLVNTLHDHWLLCPNNMLLREDYTICDPAVHPQGCADCLRGYDYWADVPHRRRLFQRLTRGALFLSPSQALIDYHVAAGYDPDRFRLVRLGFAETSVQASRHPAVARMRDAARTRPLVAYTGGGVGIKGSQVMLEMLPLLYQRLPEVRVALAGSMDFSTTAAFQQQPNAYVLGRLPFVAMRSLFALADLSLLPSIWPENSPVTIFENYQAGTPVAGSRIGGIPELIDHGRTGYLTPYGDPAALADAVVEHFTRPAVVRRRMRRACLETVRTEFSLDQHLDALQAVYAEVAA
ncbi:MAG: glycosyltransferase [Caldilineaceae bacterium]|nr:glycosyltransferase [Caldilineaceae bacterium]